MQCTITCVLLLTVCSYWTIAAERRVVLMIPRQIRRSPAFPWQAHMRSPQFRKSHYTSEDDHPHHYNRPNNIIYGKPSFRYNRNHLPHGGDDFDQDHEGINNVMVPHGKGISHGISFGRGYIPYDRIKGKFSPLNEDHRHSEDQHQEESPEEESSFSPVDPSHVSLTSESDSNSYFSDQSGPYKSQLDGKTNDQSKLFISRSIGKDSFGSKTSLDKSNSASNDEEKPISGRSPDSFPSSDFSISSIISHSETTSPAPIFVPSSKIGGSTQGVVIRDSVSLDDYNRRVEEFTKSWPGVVNIPGIHGSNIQHAAQTIQQLPTSYFAGSSFPAAYPWTSSLAQGSQGYAVKEDISEPPHDFRTMPVQSSQIHSFPIPGSATLPNIQTAYG